MCGQTTEIFNVTDVTLGLNGKRVLHEPLEYQLW
jgi:hypothetical protein